MQNIKIPEGARFILKKLAPAEAYVVGGCVRDSLMGLEPNNWDITTSATPEEVKACFGDIAVDTGIKYGTVTVCCDDGRYEVTTFRTDGQYTDGRRPDEVKFTSSLVEDLKRRDFTMNAIAADADGVVHDPLNGAADIQAGLVRCVGDPEARFREDHLRILRALRFSSRFGFAVEENTAAAIHACKDLLSTVSAERVEKELTGILCGRGAYRVLTQYHDVLAVLIPEIEACVGFEQNNPYHCYDVWKHTAASVEAVKPDPILRLTMLFHDLGKPACYTEDEAGIGHFHGHAKISAEITQKRMRALRFSNEMVLTVTQLVLYHDARPAVASSSVLRMLNKLGEEQMRRLLKVRRADIEAQSGYDYQARIDKVANLKVVLEKVLSEQRAFKVKDLAVNGHDLIAAGVRPGPGMGALLNDMLEAVIDGKVENTREKLLGFAKEKAYA